MNKKLDIPTYFNIISKHSSKSGWSTDKAMSEGLSQILYPDIKGIVHDTFFNKFLKGINKGKALYTAIQDLIAEKKKNNQKTETEAFTGYITQTESHFASINNKNNKFDLQAVIEELVGTIENAANISGRIHSGLTSSYKAHQENRPYMFLAESLYYALALQNNENAEYMVLDSGMQIALIKDKAGESAVWMEYVDREILESANCSKRTMEALNLMDREEIEIFIKLAKLSIIDEDEEPYLYAPVTDEEIELYKVHGISNREFFVMEGCGIINMGARIKNIMDVTDDDYYGFQNDNLVLAITAEKGHSHRVEYRSYSFTPAGIQLLELFQVDTDDLFFAKLVEYLKAKLKEYKIILKLINVEDAKKNNIVVN